MGYEHNQTLDNAAEEIERADTTTTGSSILLNFLNERSHVYKLRGSSDVDRLRGYALACMSKKGMASQAISFILEELETGLTPYTVGAAAYASRHIEAPPDELGNLLLSAATRMRESDESIWFDTIHHIPHRKKTSSVISEIFKSITHHAPKSDLSLATLQGWQENFGGNLSITAKKSLAQAIKTYSTIKTKNSSCCCSKQTPRQKKGIPNLLPTIPQNIWELSMQGQNGHKNSLGGFIKGKPSVIAFFYTRCMNPSKCSMTISNLAALQKKGGNGDTGLPYRVIGITYDPAWDRAKQLTSYGQDRGLEFNNDVWLLRNLEGWEETANAFDLSVGYGPATVNRHRIDLFIINADLTIHKRFTQRAWSAADVFQELSSII